MNNKIGPQTAAADSLHAMKYREVGEDFREAMNRIAARLADNEDHFRAFRSLLNTQAFMPAGRVQAAIGSSRNVTALNCYASGTIADSYVDGPGSIMGRAHEAAATMRMGGGIGYDFSTLRPKGDLIRKLSSHSSGPISFMRIFNEVCLCTSSAGHRRGAQMGVLRVDHPDIEEFIHAKQNNTALTGFNISVAVTDAFMKAVDLNNDFNLTFKGTIYRTVRARDLWEKIMRSTWDWAEPGVLFIDRMNEMNNLYYCEEIATTNPCSEQPLPPYGACLLGSFNLVKYLTRGENDDDYSFDYEAFKRDIPVVVRAMDNVVDAAIYPLPEQGHEERTKRRMGLGVTGLANTIEALGHAYGTPDFLTIEEEILFTLCNESYKSSALLAHEKGPFLQFDRDKYCAGKFISNLPEETQELIYANGIRNSHLTSIAPTGTISMCADNVSSGLEPVFSYTTKRNINTPEGPVLATIEDYGLAYLGVRGKLSKDVTAQEHVDVLTTAQYWVDSSVSKTINMTGSMPWEDFKDVYTQAWKGGCKGASTFNSDGKRMALLTGEDDTSDAQCTIDLTTGKKECG